MQPHCSYYSLESRLGTEPFERVESAIEFLEFILPNPHQPVGESARAAWEAGPTVGCKLGRFESASLLRFFQLQFELS